MIRLLLLLTLWGVALPRGTKPPASGSLASVSPKSYRDTVDFFTHALDRGGAAYHVVGPYRARGVDVTRFVSDAPDSAWLAIHVYRVSAKTWISVIPRPSSPLDDDAPGG